MKIRQAKKVIKKLSHGTSYKRSTIRKAKRRKFTLFFLYFDADLLPGERLEASRDRMSYTYKKSGSNLWN